MPSDGPPAGMSDRPVPSTTAAKGKRKAAQEERSRAPTGKAGWFFCAICPFLSRNFGRFT